MIKYLRFSILCLLAMSGVSALAQSEIYMVLADGNIATYSDNEIDYITIYPSDDGKSFVHEVHLKDKSIIIKMEGEFKNVILNDIITTPSDGLVDLGLSVKWGAMNYGAKDLNQYGELVGWGDPTGTHKEQYAVKSYGAYDTNKNKVLDYYGGVTPPDEIGATDKDISTVKMGDKYRLPSIKEADELVSKCEWMWLKYRGVEGVRVTGPNGNSIFLPAAGRRTGDTVAPGNAYKPDEYGAYWTGSWYGTSDSTSKQKGEMAFCIGFGITNGGFYKTYSAYRYAGCSVRPVENKK